MNDWQDYWKKQANIFKQRCFKERDKFLQALDSPMQAQESVLKNIVTHMQGTVFAKTHHFNNIKGINDFQSQVPIRDYQGFLPWLDAEVKQGQGNFSSSPLLNWLKTSGSTGDSKKIPYTTYWMQHFRVPGLCVLWANYLNEAPDLLAHPYATLDTQTVRENYQDFLNGVPYTGITNRNVNSHPDSWSPPWFEAPWFTADVPSSYDERMYYRLRYLVGEDLRTIFAINPSTLVALEYHFKQNITRLVKEIAEGTVNEKFCLEPNPALAKKIKVIAASPNFHFKLLWPNLSLLSCWTSASAKLYQKQIEALFPNTKLLPFMTCGTEGIVTLPIDNHFITGPLAINQGFFEFLPADVDLEAIIKKGKPVKALLFNELELDKEYHLIMTQGSGMCRYAVGDIFKVTDFYKGVPRIEFSQRQGTYHSFTGEKITEKQLLAVMEDVIQTFKLDGSLFMFCPVFAAVPYYKVLIEVKQQHGLPILSHDIEMHIDKLLCAANEEFDSKRKSARLGSVKPYFVDKGTINAFIEAQKKHSNAIQYKYKPFQKDEKVFNQILMLDQRALEVVHAA